MLHDIIMTYGADDESTGGGGGGHVIRYVMGRLHHGRVRVAGIEQIRSHDRQYSVIVTLRM